MISNIFLLCFIFNQIKIIFSAIYPDHYCSYDAPFESANTKGYRFKQIYSLGYFTNKTEDSIYSKKFGIFYEPIVGDFKVENDEDEINQFLLYDKWITKSSSTEENENFSEEFKLFQKVISPKALNKITISKIFINIQLTGYELTYIFPFSLNGTGTINKMEVSINDNIICDKERVYTPNSHKYLIIIVVPTGSSSGNKIFKFSCYDNNNSTKYESSLTIGQNEELEIKFYSLSKIYLSHYKAYVNDNTASQSSKLYYTKNNYKTCSSSGNNECLLGYYCSSNECKKCLNKCSSCTDGISCSKCSQLSDDSTDSDCTINYIDISNFNDMTFNTTVNLKSNRVTLGFWLFFPDIQSTQTNDGNVFHVVIEDHIIISIVLNTGKETVTTYCHAKENLFNTIKNFTNSNSFSNVNSYPSLASEFAVFFETPSEEQINNLGRSSLSGQWFHVSCGFNPDSNELYLNTIINGKDNSKKIDLLPEIIYTDLSPDKTRNTYHFKKIYNSEDVSYLKILKAKYLNKKVYIRNLIMFREFILRKYKYMYYNYKSSVANFKEIALYIPFDKLDLEDECNIKYYLNDEEKPFYPSKNGDYDSTIPLNFKHLNILGINEFFERVDLNVINNSLSSSCSDSYCHNNIKNKFKCNDGLYLNGLYLDDNLVLIHVIIQLSFLVF